MKQMMHFNEARKKKIKTNTYSHDSCERQILDLVFMVLSYSAETTNQLINVSDN